MTIIPTTHIVVLSHLVALKNVFASLEQVKQMIQELTEKNSIESSDRYLVNAFASLNFFGEGYGCHCHFWENALKGQGKPVDEVDSRCRIQTKT